MKNLLRSWPEVAGRLAAAPEVLLLLDFDGTLAPIVSDPAAVRPTGRQRGILRRLAARPPFRAAVISGRALRDIAERVAVPGLVYVGNHGAERMDVRGRVVRRYPPSGGRILRVIEKALASDLAEFRGVRLENKGPILAVHYRQVRLADRRRVLSAVFNRMRLSGRWVTIARGKAVLEARLRGLPNKGDAVRDILRTRPRGTVPVYLGDDKTDEDGFRAVRDCGLGVAVGRWPAPPPAAYCLRNPTEVWAALARLLSLPMNADLGDGGVMPETSRRRSGPRAGGRLRRPGPG